jgi:hypothetical protein
MGMGTSGCQHAHMVANMRQSAKPVSRWMPGRAKGRAGRCVRWVRVSSCKLCVTVSIVKMCKME